MTCETDIRYIQQYHWDRFRKKTLLLLSILWTDTMEKEKLHVDPLRAVQANWQRVHTVRLVLCFLFNVLVLIGVVAYGGFYMSGQMDRMSDRIDQLTRDNMEMKYQIERLKKQSQVMLGFGRIQIVDTKK